MSSQLNAFQHGVAALEACGAQYLADILRKQMGGNMTVCRECSAIEQGYKTMVENGEEFEVCAVCESEEIGEVNEDYGSDR